MNSNKRHLYTLLFAAGFVLIPLAVPRIAALIAGHKISRSISLLIIAFFFYVWGEVCLYIKNRNDLD